MATTAARSGTYFRLLRWPIILAAVNSLASGLIFDWPFGDVAYNVVRVAILVYAAWLLIQGGITNLWLIALAGLLLSFIDHPVVRGGSFLLAGETMAFYGVLISFVMFAAVPMVIAALSGYLMRRRLSNVAI